MMLSDDKIQMILLMIYHHTHLDNLHTVFTKENNQYKVMLNDYIHLPNNEMWA